MLKGSGDPVITSKGFKFMPISKLVGPAAIVVFWLGLQPVLAADGPVADEQPGDSALQQSIRLREQIEQLNEQLADLESEYGPFDFRLLEPLRGLTDIQLDIGDYEQAGSTLERRLQLVRTVEGPASLQQLPIVQQLIANDIRLSDWGSVTDRFEFIRSLYGQDADTDPETTMRVKNDLALWNFANVYLQEPVRRLRIFRQAREAIRENTRAAEDLYGENSMELVTWLYQNAVMQHQHARDEILLAEGRNAESYQREALNLVKRIRDIAAESGDLEAEAMAMTYEADFQMLLELGTAARLYSQAMDKFIEAGLDSNRVDGFFQRPAILPVAKFYPRLEDAVRSQDEAGFAFLPTPEGEPPAMHLGTFVAWSESLPYSERPELPAAAAELESELEYFEIAMDFTLNSRGTTRNPDITDSNTDRARVRRDARQALRAMQFRPYFEEGRWRPSGDLSIRYLILPD
jgi:hypothetical protein